MHERVNARNLRAALGETLKHLETVTGPKHTARYADGVKAAIITLHPYRELLSESVRQQVADTIRAALNLSPLFERELWFMLMVYDPYVVPLTKALRSLHEQLELLEAQ